MSDSVLKALSRGDPEAGDAKVRGKSDRAQASRVAPSAGGPCALERNALVQGANPGAANAGAAFADNLGGGLDLRMTHRFSIRLAEADYLLTTFDSGTNNHQNNLCLSVGVVIHFR